MQHFRSAELDLLRGCKTLQSGEQKASPQITKIASPRFDYEDPHFLHRVSRNMWECRLLCSTTRRCSDQTSQKERRRRQGMLLLPGLEPEQDWRKISPGYVSSNVRRFESRTLRGGYIAGFRSDPDRTTPSNKESHYTHSRHPPKVVHSG